MSSIAVVFTGGTIAMRHDPQAGGAVPVLDGAKILERTPGLDAIARVEAVDWGLIPASHLSFAQLLDLAAAVRAQLARADDRRRRRRAGHGRHRRDGLRPRPPRARLEADRRDRCHAHGRRRWR